MIFDFSCLALFFVMNFFFFYAFISTYVTEWKGAAACSGHLITDHNTSGFSSLRLDFTCRCDVGKRVTPVAKKSSLT